MAMDTLAMGDFKGLHQLKQLAQKDSEKAMPEVAKQFEGIFLQAMLKSMRQSSSFLDEDSPFKSKSTEQYQDMLDSQYSLEMAKGKGIGLAQFLTRQLAQGKEKTKDAEQLLDTSRLQHPIAAKPMQHITLKPEPSANEKSMVDQFVESVLPLAKKAAGLLGLDPKILIAQAALETGWGRFITQDEKGNNSNNLFNIKATGANGEQAVTVKTTEYIANTPIKTNALFKKYDTLEQSFQDYVSLIKGSGRYQEALAQTSSPASFISALHKAGFATDPNYSEKVMNVYDSKELQQALHRAGLKG